MRDRLSTKILSNGATRYGVYDETGNLLRYEYIKLEDEPTVEGDLFSKANMLPDSIPAALGLKMGNPQVKDALNVLANIGNVHVWQRVQSGVTDYLTSTDRNAYPDQSAEGGEPEIPAHCTLADAVTVDVLSSSADYAATLYVCDLNSIIINNYGSINTTSFSVLISGSDALSMAGNWHKFSPTKAYYITSGSSNVVFTDTIFTVSAETTLQYADGKYVLPGCRELIGHAKVEAIPPNTSITYLGQLGEPGAKIEVGSYVGTGTSSATITLGYQADFLAVFYKDRSGTDLYYHGFALPNFPWSTSNITMLAITNTGFTVRYNAYGGSLSYLNSSGATYVYIAFRKG